MTTETLTTFSHSNKNIVRRGLRTGVKVMLGVLATGLSLGACSSQGTQTNNTKGNIAQTTEATGANRTATSASITSEQAPPPEIHNKISVTGMGSLMLGMTPGDVNRFYEIKNGGCRDGYQLVHNTQSPSSENDLIIAFGATGLDTISTRDPQTATPEGLHVGSKMNQVRDVYGKNIFVEYITSMAGAEVDVLTSPESIAANSELLFVSFDGGTTVGQIDLTYLSNGAPEIASC